jgi:uncharacterized membrane protein
MMKYTLLYIATVPVFFLIDLLWLGIVAKDFYRSQIGHLMADPFVWWAAILFYVPALEVKIWTRALLFGAAFGFFTYMTYDLTNLATLRGWPIKLVVVDILWGTFLSASVATASYFIGARFFS